MKVRRDIASIPKRSAAETWRVIVDLVTGSGSVEAETLTAAASVMESLIADECPAGVPIVVKGVGARLVIYCLFGEEALEAGADVDKLNWNPTAGNWAMMAPAEAGDVDLDEQRPEGSRLPHQDPRHGRGPRGRRTCVRGAGFKDRLGSARLTMNVVNTLSFSRTHTATYVSDKMRNLLKTLILDYGLDPKLLVDAWSDWVHDAAGNGCRPAIWSSS